VLDIFYHKSADARKKNDKNPSTTVVIIVEISNKVFVIVHSSAVSRASEFIYKQ